MALRHWFISGVLILSTFVSLQAQSAEDPVATQGLAAEQPQAARSAEPRRQTRYAWPRHPCNRLPPERRSKEMRRDGNANA